MDDKKKIVKTELEDKKDFILKYVELSPTFTYGLDELLNTIAVNNLDELSDDEVDRAVDMIKSKRVRFLRSQLANPSLKPHQIRGIELALTMDGDAKPVQTITFEFKSNIKNKIEGE